MKTKKGGTKNKKGQVTIFVILAILIVGILIFAFYPNIKKLFVISSPSEFVSDECLKENIEPVLENVLLVGGNLNPELYFNYNNDSLNYLCYTSEWYKTCVMQDPLLKQSIEREIEKNSQSDIKECIDKMQKRFESRGYNVEITGTKKANIEIVPDKVIVSLDMEMTIEKDGVKQEYPLSTFKTSFNSKSYKLVMIASSIQNYEARYGDSIIETYMAYYPDVKVEKYKQSDGTKVYIVSHRDTGEKLQFATRSLAWPPGYYIA